MPRAEVLALDGEVDLHLSPEVAASLRTIVAKKPDQVVVDLAKVTYLDSSGLAVLIDGLQKTQEYGGEFFLAALREDILPILETARLDQVFKILPGADCAVAA